MAAPADGDTGKSAESQEEALAREEANMLLAEQRKIVALKVGRGLGTSVSHSDDESH